MTKGLNTLQQKADALENELQGSTVTVDGANLNITYKGYETTINTETGSMTELAKIGTSGPEPEENAEIDWENILNQANEKHPHQTEKEDIGIDANGNVCNLDLWEYWFNTDDECWVIGGSYDSDGMWCYKPMWDDWDDANYPYGPVERTNIVCPQYIKEEGGENFYPVGYLGNSAFYHMESLRSIKLPSTLTFIGSSFEGCSNLTNISLPESMQTINFSAFQDCSNLTRINLPDGLKEIEGGAFSGCNLSGSVILPSSLETLGNRAFYGCDELESITIRSNIASNNWNTDCFHGISNLKELYIDDESLSTDILSNSYFCFSVFYPIPDDIYLKKTLDCSEEDTVTVYINGEYTYKYKGIINGYSKLEYVDED